MPIPRRRRGRHRASRRSRAGLGVAAEGGNAVDAALAAAFVALATEPGMVSFGGGAFVAVWPAGGEPGRRRRQRRHARRGLAECGSAPVCARCVTTVRRRRDDVCRPRVGRDPGASCPAFAVAHDRFARLAWARLLAPGRDAARDGYPMSPAAARYLASSPTRSSAQDPEAHALVTARRRRACSRGRDHQQRPARRRARPAGRRRSRRCSAPGPSGGRWWPTWQRTAGWSRPPTCRPTTRVLRPAAPPRRRRLADRDQPAAGGGRPDARRDARRARPPAGTGRWARRDRDPARGARLPPRVHDLSRDLEADGIALLAPVGRAGLGALRGSSSTAHVSAVDDRGQRVRDHDEQRLRRRDVHPRHRDPAQQRPRRGRAQPARASTRCRPGTRLASNMAPTTGRTADGRVLAIGSPGADRITTALMLVLGQGCLHGADLVTRSPAPGCTSRLARDAFRVEYEADPGHRRGGVGRRACRRHEYPEPHMYFGGVGAAYRPRGGASRPPATPAARQPWASPLASRPGGAAASHLRALGAQLVDLGSSPRGAGPATPRCARRRAAPPRRVRRRGTGPRRPRRGCPGPAARAAAAASSPARPGG